MSGFIGLVGAYLMMMFPMYVMLWRYRFPGAAYLSVLPFSLLLMIGAILGNAIVQSLVQVGNDTTLSFPKCLIGFALFPLTGIVYVWWLTLRSTANVDRHFRGSQVFDGDQEQRQTLKLKRKQGRQVLTLAGVAVPPIDEPKHFKLLGVTGAGKSSAITELMQSALALGDRAIFADPDGGYLKRFYNPARGDLILNPFDTRSASWDLFGEIKTSYDIEDLARSLIAEGEGSAREWRAYARVFLSEVIRYCHTHNIHDLSELWRLLAIASNDELRPVVAGTPAQPFLDVEAARMFASLRAVCASCIGSFRYLQEKSNASLSVRQWIQSGRGVLFITYSAGQIAALSNVIATWVRLAVFETMNRPEQPPEEAEPLWFVIDELDALGKIDGLQDALARLRKFGGRCIVGFQSIAQVSGTYGEKDARTIVENCGNTLILRCSSSERGGTAEFASRLIGEREVERTEHSTSRSRPSFFSGEGSSQVSDTTSVRRVTETAVMPSEIEQLPDLAGYLKLASQSYWMRITFQRPT